MDNNRMMIDEVYPNFRAYEQKFHLAKSFWELRGEI